MIVTPIMPLTGNTGIVPPWLQGPKDDMNGFVPLPGPVLPPALDGPTLGLDMVGIAPVDPDTPHIM